jgi:peptide deformylase
MTIRFGPERSSQYGLALGVASQAAIEAGQWKAMRLKIFQAGEAVLRGLARPLTREEIVSDEIRRLIGDMFDTMRDAPGVGLAAPQVGLPLQLAVIEDREELLNTLPAEELAEKERVPVPFHVIINPEITIVEHENLDFYEGCLSLAGFSAVVPRPRKVSVAYLDEHAQPRSVHASGWYARILQHEIDHLHGTMYIDRMRSRSFTSLDNWNRFWKKKPVHNVLEELKN